MTAGGFPHSEILGSKPCRRLPEAYRGPTRPSSVLSAKASTIRPCKQPDPNRSQKARTASANSQTTHHHTRTITKRSKKIYEINSRTTHRETPAGVPLASTIQFSNHHAPTSPAPTTTRGHRTRKDTRQHQPPESGRGGQGTQKHAAPPPTQTATNDLFHTSTPTPHATDAHDTGHTPAPTQGPENLRRKEVIQPHLPVRLPCYDLVPITSLTLDGSPQEG